MNEAIYADLQTSVPVKSRFTEKRNQVSLSFAFIEVYLILSNKVKSCLMIYLSFEMESDGQGQFDALGYSTCSSENLPKIY
jgi:hypothetical protein